MVATAAAHSIHHPTLPIDPPLRPPPSSNLESVFECFEASLLTSNDRRACQKIKTIIYYYVTDLFKCLKIQYNIQYFAHGCR